MFTAVEIMSIGKGNKNEKPVAAYITMFMKLITAQHKQLFNVYAQDAAVYLSIRMTKQVNWNVKNELFAVEMEAKLAAWWLAICDNTNIANTGEQITEKEIQVSKRKKTRAINQAKVRRQKK